MVLLLSEIPTMKAPVTGSLVLREMLLRHAKDGRSKSLTLILSQSTSGKGFRIYDESYAPRIVEQGSKMMDQICSSKIPR